MNIESKKWYLRSAPSSGHFITNRTTHEMRLVLGVPEDGGAMLDEKTWDKRCEEAFESGKWKDS